MTVNFLMTESDFSISPLYRMLILSILSFVVQADVFHEGSVSNSATSQLITLKLLPFSQT